MKPTVYEMDNCRACVNTKRKLTELGVSFDVEDATEPGSAAAIAELNYKQAPVVVWGTEHWSGYRPDRIEQLAARIGGK